MEGYPRGLEESLSKLEGLAGDALKASMQSHAALMKLRRAVEVGETRHLTELFDAAESSAGDVLEQVRMFRARWQFPTEAYLKSGLYAQELLSIAQASGIEVIREVDGRLYSFPTVVVVATGGQYIKVGARTQYGLRPTHVIQLLGSLASSAKARADKVNADTLESFEKAYLKETRGETGVAIGLANIYDILTIRPRQATEYSQIDFLTEIYALDIRGPRLTRGGRHLSLPASTSTRGGQGYRVVAESGEEKLYSSIRFDFPQPSG
jgi:hypothetical protein